MFPRQQRLRRKQDILEVMRKGKRIDTPHVRIFQHANSKQESRFTAIAGKKIHSSAVQRHRYQRWLRELARDAISHIKGAHDMVWMAKPSIVKVISLAELKESLSPYLKDLT